MNGSNRQMSSTESRREVQGDVDMASSRPGIRLMKSLVSRVWHTLQAESKMQGGTVRNPRPGWWKHRSGLSFSVMRCQLSLDVVLLRRRDIFLA